MRRRWLVNGLLGIVVIALALVLWTSRKPTPAPGPPPTASTLAPAAIDRIEIHTGAHVIVLARGSDRAAWRMRQPVAARADPVHVAALLHLAAAKAHHRYARGAIAPRTTGLASPRLVVRYNNEAPIAIGGSGPSPGTRYLRTAHSLLLVPAPDLAGLALAWPHWIDPALVAKNARLTRLVLPRLTLTRGPDKHWRIAPPGAGHSARDAAATAAAWQRVKALSVVAADTQRQRRARITLDFAAAPPRHLDIVETRPHLILRDSTLGVDYRLAGNRVAPLLDARHPRLFDSAASVAPGSVRQ